MRLAERYCIWKDQVFQTFKLYKVFPLLGVKSTEAVSGLINGEIQPHKIMREVTLRTQVNSDNFLNSEFGKCIFFCVQIMNHIKDNVP